MNIYNERFVIARNEKNDLNINYGKDKEKNMEELVFNAMNLSAAYAVASEQVRLYTSMTKEIIKITASEPMDETKIKIKQIMKTYLHEIYEQYTKQK